jgi:hypothetical protein
MNMSWIMRSNILENKWNHDEAAHVKEKHEKCHIRREKKSHMSGLLNRHQQKDCLSASHKREKSWETEKKLFANNKARSIGECIRAYNVFIHAVRGFSPRLCVKIRKEKRKVIFRKFSRRENFALNGLKSNQERKFSSSLEVILSLFV